MTAFNTAELSKEAVLLYLCFGSLAATLLIFMTAPTRPLEHTVFLGTILSSFGSLCWLILVTLYIEDPELILGVYFVILAVVVITLGVLQLMCFVSDRERAIELV